MHNEEAPYLGVTNGTTSRTLIFNNIIYADSRSASRPLISVGQLKACQDLMHARRLWANSINLWVLTAMSQSKLIMLRWMFLRGRVRTHSPPSTFLQRIVEMIMQLMLICRWILLKIQKTSNNSHECDEWGGQVHRRKWLEAEKKEINNLTTKRFKTHKVGAIEPIDLPERDRLKSRARSEGHQYIEVFAKVVWKIKPDKFKCRIAACGNQTQNI